MTATKVIYVMWTYFGNYSEPMRLYCSDRVSEKAIMSVLKNTFAHYNNDFKKKAKLHTFYVSQGKLKSQTFCADEIFS